MKSAVCGVARYENDYLPEWIKYHLDLGFDKIILYDNNDPDDLSLYALLKEHELEDKVEVIDYRGRKSFQLEAYNCCYRDYGGSFDWIAYIDVDEFLTFGREANYKNINDYLADAVNADVIEVNWMIYADNGQSIKQPGGVIERFPNPNPLDNPINDHVKSIVRTGGDMGFHRNPHCVDGDLRIVDDCFNEVAESSPFKAHSYKKLYIRHYITKTIEEYIKIKIKRGAADCADTSWRYNLSLFYRDNKRNREKRNVEKHLCPLKMVIAMDIVYFFRKMGLSSWVRWIKV